MVEAAAAEPSSRRPLLHADELSGGQNSRQGEETAPGRMPCFALNFVTKITGPRPYYGSSYICSA